MATLGERTKLLRKSLKLSQQQFVNQFNLSFGDSTLSKFESGKIVLRNYCEGEIKKVLAQYEIGKESKPYPVVKMICSPFNKEIPLNQRVIVEKELTPEEVMLQAQLMWEEAFEEGSCDYLTHYKIHPYGLRYMKNDKSDSDIALVPMYDSNGTLCNLTRLFDSSTSVEYPLKGGRKNGLSYVLGEFKDAVGFGVAPSYQVAAYFHERTNLPVVCLFGVGNIINGTEYYAQQYPDLPIYYFLRKHEKDLDTMVSKDLEWLKFNEAFKRFKMSEVIHIEWIPKI